MKLRIKETGRVSERVKLRKPRRDREYDRRIGLFLAQLSEVAALGRFALSLDSAFEVVSAFIRGSNGFIRIKKPLGH